MDRDKVRTVLEGLNSITDNVKHWTPEQTAGHAQDLAVMLSDATKPEPTLREVLADLKRKAKEFADADYAHAAQGGGIYFTADHIRGGAAAYADMVKHIEQAERACGADA